MLGGRIGLLLILSLALASCATTSQTQDGPPPSQDSISYFIYAWDKAERTNKPCPAAYRDLFAQSLKALSDSLAETERERARNQ
jgi:hypothetical protein